MKYFFESILTVSYWRYALFSQEAAAKFLSAIGSLYLFVELLDTFSIYTKDKYSSYALLVIVIFSVLYVLCTRRPVSKVNYKVPGKDFEYEVRIGDLLDTDAEIVISSSSTFDTDMAGGLISQNSLQGQLALRFFQGNTAEIDRQIEASLENDRYEINPSRPAKKKEFRIGTTACVKSHGKNFYFVAMSHMNEHGNAESSVRIIDEALERLWDNLANRGELGDIAIPLIGTGRGRISLPRKKMIEKIAQSFADASREKAFSNRLIIVVHPNDASKFSLNLFQVRDYLSQSLHV